MTPGSPTHTPPRPGLGYRVIHVVMGPMMEWFGLSCRSYAELCSARLDRPLTASERLRFRFHGLMCHLCRPLSKQLEHLRALARCAGCEDPAHTEAAAAPAEALGEEAARRIRRALQHESSVDPP